MNWCFVLKNLFGSQSFSVLRGKGFEMSSLDIHVNLSMKKLENVGVFRGKADGLFKRRKTAGKQPENSSKRPFIPSPQGNYWKRRIRASAVVLG